MKNALTMKGRIDPCWLFVFRASAEKLLPRLPEPLELVTKGDHSFVNIVVCRLHNMRPALAPLPFNLTYWHIAYRLYARYKGEEGLYFLRSDADSALINLTGNLLTSFQFHPASVHVSERNIDVKSQGANIRAELGPGEQLTLNAHSPFRNIREAAEFLKYKPAAFSVENKRASILRITRDEAAWQSRLVEVRKADFEFLDKLCPEAQLELCYEVQPIDYIWNRAEVLA